MLLDLTAQAALRCERRVVRVGQKTWRGWQSWARRLLLPGLDRPGHWNATGSEWVATSYGVMGQPVEWLAQGVERVASRWGGAFMAHAIVVPLFIPGEIAVPRFSNVCRHPTLERGSTTRRPRHARTSPGTCPRRSTSEGGSSWSRQAPWPGSWSTPRNSSDPCWKTPGASRTPRTSGTQRFC